MITTQTIRRPTAQALLLLVCVLVFAGATQAQETTPVVAITQDFAALRAGPGLAFERVDVVPPEVELPVIGRTVTTNWLQVEYQGQRGWIAARLLAWRGDALTLPVDGVDPAAFARRTVTTALVYRDAPYYALPVPQAGTSVGTLAAGAEIELTARFGSGEMIWLQFLRDGAYYWVGAWHLTLRGDLFVVPDAAAIFPYGRVLGGILQGEEQGMPAYSAIRTIWNDINAGYGASCNSIPEPAPPITLFSETDLVDAPTLTPAARGMLDFIAHTNAAIALFEQACAAGERVIARETVDAALRELAEAERAVAIALVLFDPLAQRDPLLGG